MHEMPRNPAAARHVATPKVSRAPARDDSSTDIVAGEAADVVYCCSSSIALITRMKRSTFATSRSTETPRLFARLPTVMQATGLGRSTIYRLVASGAFPAPVHLGPRAVAWRWADLDQWSESRHRDSH